MAGEHPRENGWTMEEKENLFAQLYVFECNFNASEAYRRMRKEVADEDALQLSTVRCMSSKFKNKPSVLAKIEELKRQCREDFEIDKAEIVSALKRLAFPAPEDKVSTKAQLDALEKLNKMAGYYEKNINLTADTTIDVVIE